MTTIRPARLGDANRLYELLRQFAWSTTPQREAFDKNYPRMLDDPKTYFRVAEEDGLVVGYSLGTLQWTLYANGPVHMLQELMVDVDHRSEGVGKLLMENVVAEAKEAGAMEVTLATRRAAEYYPRFGFEETAIYFKLKLNGK